MIDELSGTELAAAAAETQGWQLDDPFWESDEVVWRVCDYRPDCDIGQAWDLALGIERPNEPWGQQYPLHVQRRPWADDPREDWMARIGRHTALGTTAPEAICRAYLKAKGYQKAPG